MAPHADFACLGHKCRGADGAAPVYDLPVSARRCPVCGSRRIQRIFNAVNVGAGIAKKVDAIADGPMNAAFAQRDAQREAARRVGAIQAVPIRELGTALGRIHPELGGLRIGAEIGAARPTGDRAIVEGVPSFALPRHLPGPARAVEEAT